MELGGILPDRQAGFRKEKGPIDNVYVLKHLADRELDKKGGKLYALFLDLKEAFDKMDKGKLWAEMGRRGITEHLIARVKEIYMETRARIKVGDKLSHVFWTTKGLRQGHTRMTSWS
nr:uncharacterized protein LOC111423506 [Onthophagus taurus]